MKVSGQLHASAPLTPGETAPKAPNTHCIAGWIGPRISPGIVVKRKILLLPGIEPQLSDHPASSLVSILTKL